MLKSIGLSTLLIGVVTFIFGGLAQVFPWGVPTVQNVSTIAPEDDEVFGTDAEAIVRYESSELVTSAFEEQMVDKVSTLATPSTFSWVVTKPYSYYDQATYFTKELFIQLLTGLLISYLLWQTRPLHPSQRLSLVAVAALLALTVYGQQMNWWGLPATYGVGMGINMLLSWTLGAWLAIRFVMKSLPIPTGAR